MTKYNTKDKSYLDLAVDVAKSGDCKYRNYGAVIVKNDSVLSTGYTNTQLIGCGSLCCHCLNAQKEQARKECTAIHASVAAIGLAQADLSGSTIYLAGIQMYNGRFDRVLDTVYPCRTCITYILNSGITTLICRDKGEIARLSVSQLDKEYEVTNG